MGPTRKFLEQVHAGRFQLVLSALVMREIRPAPEMVQNLYTQLLPLAEVAERLEEATQLQEAYIHAGIVTQKSLPDALHVALATVNDCELIVSWNFKHIVHFQKIPLYNEINSSFGYRSLAIHTPQEVIEDEDEGI